MNSSFYILSLGKLFVKERSISFEDQEGIITDVPIKQVNELFLNIAVSTTPDILALLMKEKITVHYFDRYENYLGTLIPKEAPVSAKVLLKEIETYQDSEKRLKIAKAIIHAAMANINNVVKYYVHRKGITYSLDFNLFSNKVLSASSINHLMLIEATFRKYYYEHVGQILDVTNYHRVMQGASDIINVLFNFLNSLLYGVIFGEIKKTHVSGQFGFIHEIADNRYPLVYDISEIFKPLLVDRLIYRMINRKQLSTNDLVAGRLTEDAIRTIFAEWDKEINTKIYHKQLKRYLRYRDLIREEIYKLERFYTKDDEYKGFIYWW